MRSPFMESVIKILGRLSRGSPESRYTVLNVISEKETEVIPVLVELRAQQPDCL